MKRSVRMFIDSAIDSGKGKKYVIDSLIGRISDKDLITAVKYFEKVSFRKENKKKLGLSDMPLVGVYFFRLSFLLIVFFIFKISNWIRRVLFGESEDITFEGLERSFSFASHFRKVRSWAEAKPEKNKTLMIRGGILLLILISVLFYANFIYSKNCQNTGCFREMVSGCHRSTFVSTDLVSLDNKVTGFTFKGCRVVVVAAKDSFGISKGQKMICYFPKGLKVLPQTKIEFCTGELREEIQDLIISELYEVVGQNVEELNLFFRR